MKIMHCVWLVAILAGVALVLIYFRPPIVASSPKYPVILVPGFGGSELWRKGGGSNDFEALWINPCTFLSFVVGCSNKLTEHLTLLFDNRTGKTREKSDEVVQACGFGDPTFLESLITWSWWDLCDEMVQACGFGVRGFLEYLITLLWRDPCDKRLSQKQCDGARERPLRVSVFDFKTVRMTELKYQKYQLAANNLFCPDLQSESEEDMKANIVMKFWNDLHYFKKLVETLIDEHGYVRNKDIRGAPYDFRKAPSELGDYFTDLKRLIEDTSANNDNLPVVVIAHSMGNPVMKHFYNHYTKTGWTQKYIQAHVALAPPWAGAVKMLGVLTSGENFDMGFLDSKRFRAAVRTFPSSIWLTPCVSCNGVWDDHPPIVVTPSKNYSISTEGYRQLFKDLNYEAGYDMWQWIGKDSLDVSTLPNVPALHVLYGTDVDTSHQFVFNKQADFPDIPDPSVIKGQGNGDGTVNIRSLEAMKLIPIPDGMVVNHTSFKGVDHMEICRDDRVIDYIVKLVTTVKPSVKTEL